MTYDAFLIPRNPNNSALKFATETPESQFQLYTTLVLKSFSWGASNPGAATIGSKEKFNDLIVTKSTSINSPLFLAMCSQALHSDRMTLILRKSGTIAGPVSPPIFTIYTFGQVSVTDLSYDGTIGDDMPTETLHLVFNQLAYHTYIIRPDGTTVPAARFAWDSTTNSTWANYLPLDGPVSQ